jgi:hypothetical protein
MDGTVGIEQNGTVTYLCLAFMEWMIALSMKSATDVPMRVRPSPSLLKQTSAVLELDTECFSSTEPSASYRLNPALYRVCR